MEYYEYFGVIIWIVGLSSGFIYWVYKVFFDLKNMLPMLAVTGWIMCPIFGVFSLLLLIVCIVGFIFLLPGLIAIWMSKKLNKNGGKTIQTQ